MPVDRRDVPHYVVLLSEHQSYSLNADREVLTYGVSDELAQFARARGNAQSVDDRLWKPFADQEGLSPIDRERFCCYRIVDGGETEEQLQHLINM
ncbi:hypothetical protein ACFSHT_15660 [Paraburkholderia silviterrae]|uniref:Uncharacterized protein n=1 Tax=Paraburkholderia silviterrae TaxID=2528715 RepID=A0A4R5MAD1_9BURK|nr:hypothetical protein [Paraburkholderia silviterrae]TDG23270.1 hypothetical protein EYW47_15170 [Paraburkholderia silviterrae]